MNDFEAKGSRLCRRMGCPSLLPLKGALTNIPVSSPTSVYKLHLPFHIYQLKLYLRIHKMQTFTGSEILTSVITQVEQKSYCVQS